MRPQQRVKASAAIVATALLSTGCLFSDQTAAGKALNNAPQRLARMPAAVLTVSFGSRLLRQGGLTSVPPPDPGVSFKGVMDLRSSRASYTALGGTKPSVVFDGNHVYAITPHASPLDARPWLATTINKDLQDHTLNPSAVPSSLAAYVLRPFLLLDLMSGALTGSIRNRGHDTVDGVATTRYDVRFDLFKALDEATRVHYSQRRIDDVVKLWSILGVDTAKLDDGSVWLDATGQPRRLLVYVRESPVAHSLLVLVADMHLTPMASAPAVGIPPESAVVTVPSLFQFLAPFKDAMPSRP